MRFSLLVVAIIPLFAFAGPASAASPADFESVSRCKICPRSIDGCSKIADDQSETARNRAVALFDRGVAYYSKDDTDHVITDWTEAIKLDSNYGHAYNNRAKAFLSKADYDHAIADYGEAIKLDPRTMRSPTRAAASPNPLSGATDKAQADFQKAANSSSRATLMPRCGSTSQIAATMFRAVLRKRRRTSIWRPGRRRSCFSTLTR